MATPKRQDVTCPSCSHTQREYVEANSTFCHACGHRFTLQPARPRKFKKSSRSPLPVNRRHINCVQCHHPMQIPYETESWQCPVCSEYLDLKHHVLTTTAGRSLHTYGDLLIQKTGNFGGNRAEAENIRINGGRVSGIIRARARLEIFLSPHVNADLKCETFHINAGAVVHSRKSLQCRDAIVEGDLKLRTAIIDGPLVVKSGGKLQTDELQAQRILVEPGGCLIALKSSTLRNVEPEIVEPKTQPHLNPGDASTSPATP